MSGKMTKRDRKEVSKRNERPKERGREKKKSSRG